jgi:adenylate kinase family enzyme
MWWIASRKPKPVVFLLGPSGSGKSTVAEALRDRFGYLHVEIDRGVEADVFELEGLRVPWVEFLEQNNPSGLAGEIRRRLLSSRSKGAVVSFPSTIVFSEEQIQAANQHGICVAVLYGTRADCLAAFLRRESALNRGLGEEHWIKHNEESHALFGAPRYAPHRIPSFADGRHRDRKTVAKEIARRARRCR